MLHRAARYLLAAIQVIIGWEWITSGTIKVLSGNFPQGLSNTLQQGIAGNPNTWYVTFLQNIVQPNSVSVGYAIEWAEVTIGVVLISGAMLLISRPRMRGEPQHRLVIGFFALTAIVSVLSAILCINFHFWMGKGIIPGIGADAVDEGIDLDALIPLFSLVILIANLVLIKLMRGETWYSRLYQQTLLGLRRFIGMEDAPQHGTAGEGQ